VDVTWTAGRLRSDTTRLLERPWQALRRGQVSRFWLGPASAAAVLILTEVARTRDGQAFLQRWAIMRGDQPWWLTLEKVPLSLFAPAHLLPYGFAMLQVFVVLGVAQVLVGVPRTLGVALAGHVLGSLSLRVWVSIGPPVGLPSWFLHLPDAGPSVAVLAVAVFLAVRLRVLWLAGLLLAYHVAEWFVIADIAQREHLVGAAAGALAALATIHDGASTVASRSARPGSGRPAGPADPPGRAGGSGRRAQRDPPPHRPERARAEHPV
jgi:hypothetical protein